VRSSELRRGLCFILPPTLNFKLFTLYYNHMTHPHQSYLDEFKISMDKLVPLTPPEIAEEALKIHKELSEDINATEQQIHQALSLIGRKEFPYRKAYNELCAGDEEQRLQQLVMERIDEDVKKKLQDVTRHGVMLDDYVASSMFEDQLNPQERLQIEQAILLAEETLDHQCDERAHKRQAQYEELVDRWTKEATRLQSLINNLRAMGDEDPKWKGEVNSVCDRLEEGWSIVERDPSEEEVKKELEYWNTVLHETEE
ncbi:MAG: hypothetical protein ACD_66C00138G0001, partial [uncultured bacterium]